MPTVLCFAFDNLQNRAFLFTTNSVILHLAREGHLTFSYGLSFPARFQIQESYFPFKRIFWYALDLFETIQPITTLAIY